MEKEKGIEIKLRLEEDKETYCLYTNGLNNYGKPEIEIRKIPSDFVENAKKILDCAIDHVINSEKVEEYNPILIKDILHNSEFLIRMIFPKKEPLPIQENSLRIVDDYSEGSEVPISIPTIIAETYFLEGLNIMEEENYKKALELFNKSIEMKSDVSYVYKFRGEALLNNNMVDKAIEDFNKAIEMGDDDSAIFFNRAIAYALMNQYDNSIKDINYFIERNPEDAIGYEQRAIIWEKLGEKEKAAMDKRIAKVKKG